MADQQQPFSDRHPRIWKTMVRTNVVVYRLTGGRLGGRVGGLPVLLLHHVGRRSGRERVNPVQYVAEGDDLVIVASAGGSPKDPQWFRNLKANPETTVEVGRRRRPVRARQADPQEKASLWPRLVERFSEWDEYQRRTGREIPVVILSPR